VLAVEATETRVCRIIFVVMEGTTKEDTSQWLFTEQANPIATIRSMVLPFM
jgi:hypothetical protein